MAAAVVAPIVVPLIVPPVIVTALAFCVDIVPKPETWAFEMAIDVLVTEVTCPLALVTNTGTDDADPYVPAVPTGVMLNTVPVKVKPVPAV